jgi:GMP synthase (glutamine-hydrolysing)
MPEELIAVLDFGGQYSHLIARRIRECGVYSELFPFSTKPAELKNLNVKGVVLSGGPASVYEDGSPRCDPAVFQMGLPVLGVCYGLQLMVQELGGHVKATTRHEYGKADLRVRDTKDLLKGLSDRMVAWMSHGDYAETLPKGFEVIADSKDCPTAAIRDTTRKLFGVQFHPEVSHTEHGTEILRNFVGIANCRPTWNTRSIIADSLQEIREKVGDEKILCAVSGGVDSTTAAVLVHKAVGNKLTCIFVNHGLLRKDEQERIKTFAEEFKLNLHYVDASDRFLQALKGVPDPEEKRKIVGEQFIRVFDEESKRLGALVGSRHPLP